MKAIVLVLGGLTVLLNPLSGMSAQMLVMGAWDFLILQAGWIVTVAFAGSVLVLAGFEYGKYTLKAQKSAQNGRMKAKKSKTSKRDGMSYELI